MVLNPMRVEKEQRIVVVVLLDGTRIKAQLHVPKSGRVSDTLNTQVAERPFLSLTDALVRRPDGTGFRTPYIAVNRSGIMACYPLEGSGDEAEPEP